MNACSWCGGPPSNDRVQHANGDVTCLSCQHLRWHHGALPDAAHAWGMAYSINPTGCADRWKTARAKIDEWIAPKRTGWNLMALVKGKPEPPMALAGHTVGTLIETFGEARVLRETTWDDWLQLGVGAKDLEGLAPEVLQTELAVDASGLLRIPVSVDDLLDLGWSLEQMRELGFDMATLLFMGLGRDHVDRSGRDADDWTQVFAPTQAQLDRLLGPGAWAAPGAPTFSSPPPSIKRGALAF